MLVMDLIAKIRFRRSVGKESIGSIARELNLSRPTARRHSRTLRANNDETNSPRILDLRARKGYLVDARASRPGGCRGGGGRQRRRP